MDTTNPGQPWEPKKPMMGTGEGESPLVPPPAPKLDMRTLQSDLKSMQQSGGAAPQPYTPPPMNAVPPQPPARPVVSDRIVIPPQPQNPSVLPARPAAASPMPIPPQKKSGKGLMIGIISVLVILGIAAAGYFYVYPTFFKSETPTPTLPAPVPTPEPSPEPAPTPAPEPTSSPAGAPLTSHLTFFRTPADTTLELPLLQSTWTEMKAAIPATVAEVPVFKEIVAKNTDLTFVRFSDIAAAIAPSVFISEVTSQFEDDFTFFTLTDSKGTWPGLVAKVRAGGNVVALKQVIASLEQKSEFKNLFLQDPGAVKPWKEGRTGTVTNRYASMEQPGAAFNYGWSGSYLILSTAYAAFKDAVQRTE